MDSVDGKAMAKRNHNHLVQTVPYPRQVQRPKGARTNPVKYFRPLGAWLRRTPFWRPNCAATSCSYLELQNKVEGRQAPAQPSFVGLTARTGIRF